MSIYFIRIIELLGIDTLKDQNYLHVLLHTSQPIDLYWQVDSDTAKQLRMHCTFQTDDRYRLSLHIRQTEHERTGHLTKTYLTNSQRFEFVATAEFQQRLTHLKTSSNPILLLQLPFVLTPEQFSAEKAKEPKVEKFDLAKLAAVAAVPVRQVVPKTQQVTAPPVFTYHPVNNSYASSFIMQGSNAIK